MQLGIVNHLVGVDLSDVRVDEANKAVPASLRSRLEFEVRDLESWNPSSSKYDLIVLKMAFHHIVRIEYFVDLFDRMLSDEGMIYFDEYIGPKRFQFAQFDIDFCNSILKTLPLELRKDINNRTHVVGRPNLQKFVNIDPSEAVRSDEMYPLLAGKFNPSIVRKYGGNIFGWLFSRIMFRFDDHPDIIKDILDKELKLLEAKKIESHYVLAFFEKKKYE